MAFTTANEKALASHDAIVPLEIMPDHRMDPLFEAVIQAVDEAIMNVLAVSEPMTGIDGHHAEGLDRERLVATLKRFERWVEPEG